MESAHQVQAQLVPLRLPATPQFRIEAAYLAAGEVGGDFFQVFPQSGGGLLVVIGDVSGKGLKAAMLGSQVVGALRSLAQERLHPAQILARLNDQLAASTDGGFVTCCVARVSSDGLLILANAGHLAPYRNGVELATDSGFPLGVIPGVAYGETSVALESGDRLTFLSDGVVEARNAAGELFGFERTSSISIQSADQIARAAKQFGQEDNITVLTLTLAAAEVLHA
jgi:serine phosphatase RsbU (regulator of sigma subunit)